MSKPMAAASPVKSARPLAGAGPQRWLILIHQLPPTPTNLRVRTWRRLQELGALAVKQSVYVLPDTPETREDFEWLRVEIAGAGGEATVYTADHLDASAEGDLINQFRHARQQAYADLAKDLERLPRDRRRDLTRYRERFAAIERMDFFNAAGRDRVVTLLAGFEGAASSGKKGAGARSDAGAGDAGGFCGRLWVTRPRPGVDRMSSAWLIRRFIDSDARFGFVGDVRAAGDAIPFDMFGGGFGHEGDRCTFETLVKHFAISDRAVTRIAEIVHDLDLKENKFFAPEAKTIGIAIDGLKLSHADDGVLLEQGMTLFEALYRSFAHASRPPRPRPVATRARKTTRRK